MKDIDKIDKALDRAKWNAVNGEEMEHLIAGKKIAGAEPIDYPLTDGVLLYLTGDNGDLTALEIGIDPLDDEPTFYIRTASIAF